MKIDHIIAKKSELDDLLNEAVRAFQNKDEPLDHRWDAYTQLVGLGCLNRKTWSADGLTRVIDDNLSLYDDFYIERHETKSFIEMDKIINEEHDFDQEKVDAWREAVLETECSHFTYDW